jgi:dTDP-4-dehydrorhamnose 3,5-epimerase
MIEGVEVKKLMVLCDSRGRLMEILRNDDPMFSEFGQVYMTTTFPKVVKGWHYHIKQSDNVVCVSGMIKLVLCDMREGSKTYKEINEFHIGEHNSELIHIPKGIYHGWMCVGDKTSIVINMPDKVYDYNNPDEKRIPPHNNGIIDYDWHNIDR